MKPIIQSHAAPRQAGRLQKAGEFAASAKAGFAVRAEPVGTVLLLIGLLITGVALSGDRPSHVARFAAVGVGISLALSILADLRAGGLRSLIRADVLAMLSLYFLTLFEFHFPQQNFDRLISTRMTHDAVIGVLTGFAGLAIGRHLPNLRQRPLRELFTRPVPKSWMLMLFWFCLFIGFLHMLMAVKFNLPLMVHYFMTPRFTQPWGRGRLGDWKALLHELEMLLYLVPPLAGIIFARRQKFGASALVGVGAGLLFVLFYGFAGGTRNVFATYMATALIGYEFAREKPKRYELIILSGMTAILLLGATVFMLQFRQIGFKNYLDGNYIVTGETEKSLFIDYNLFSIAQLMQVFPRQHDYLGMEVPYLALVRPIPRALWAGKPEGMSISIEQVVGAEGITVAASFIGESYMAGGLFAVFITAVFFGLATGWWSHLASPHNSEMGILIYASGFFAAVISMRSLFVLTTALLPTLAAIVIGSFLVQKLRPPTRPPGPPPRNQPPPGLPGRAAPSSTGWRRNA